MLRSILTALVLAVLSTSLSAQSTTPKPVSVTGVVVKVAGPFSICQQSETHRIDCTEVFLKSSLVDLNAYVGQTVKVIGLDISVTCHVINVTQVDPAPVTLTMCGAASLGCPIKFNVCPTGAIGIWGLFASTGPAYFPISVHTGSFLLALPVVQIAGGFQQPVCSSLQTSIPALPVLVGVDVHLQGFTQDVGPVGPPVLSNPLCFTITALGLCAPIGC